MSGRLYEGYEPSFLGIFDLDLESVLTRLQHTRHDPHSLNAAVN